jgi:hypothetical protein
VDDDHDSGTESDDEFQNGGDMADDLSTGTLINIDDNSNILICKNFTMTHNVLVPYYQITQLHSMNYH